MKIIKPGLLPQNREHQITCSTFKCEFEFKQAEAKEVHDQRDGNFLQIACPCCGRQCTKYLR